MALSTDSITAEPRAVLCRRGVDELSAVQVKARTQIARPPLPGNQPWDLVPEGLAFLVC